jgi:hypothetical protein
MRDENDSPRRSAIIRASVELRCPEPVAMRIEAPAADKPGQAIWAPAIAPVLW